MPIIPPIPGVDLEHVFVAKKDVEYLSGMLKTIEASKRVVIIGGGFIGMEFADDLTKRGLDITLVEMLPHCLQLYFDDEFCEKVEEKLKEKGVKLLTDTTAEEIGGEVYGGIATGEFTNIIATLIEKRMRIDELVTLQIATHPWLTASPIGYLISNAAEMAIGELI